MNQCATLEEYMATAPTEVKPITPDKREQERLELCRNLGLRASQAVETQVRREAILAAGFRPCSPEHAVALMEPKADRVDEMPQDDDTLRAMRSAVGFWPSRQVEYRVDRTNLGPRERDWTRQDQDGVILLRAGFPRPDAPPRRWYQRRRPATEKPPSRFYALGPLRDLNTPIPYGVALRIQEINNASIFSRLAVVAPVEHFTAGVLGGDPVVLGGFPTADSWSGFRPHAWFFVALWT